jgi:hypothetical protein
MTTLTAAVTFHRRYLEVVEQIERTFRVAEWQANDLEIWPLARMDLHLDLFRSHVGVSTPRRRSLALRALTRYATPVVNAWKSRHDLRHWVASPRPAYAVMLGDGVSLDRVEGAWRDRYGEPVIAALQRRGLDTFLMQTGELSRLPWFRPTYAANVAAYKGARRSRGIAARIEVPDHDRVIRHLQLHGIRAPSLQRAALEQRARRVLATAREFERILQLVQPSLAFVVTYYADLGPAYLLACRRQRVLSVDLQHCPQEGAHKAYGWSACPDRGYAALPAVFWNWTPGDAAHIRQWTSKLPQPWHRSLHGGHVQLTPFLNDDDPQTVGLDLQYQAISQGRRYEREILVTLQPVMGYRTQWEALAAEIEAAPREWRWWIRRHPASLPSQDEEYARLVNLRLPNVMVNESAALPLPALLRHMSVVVSRFSGASAEAAQFGVPALFLSEEARGQFSNLIERGCASVVEIATLNSVIAQRTGKIVRPGAPPSPELDRTLLDLEQIAIDYRRLFEPDGLAPRER